MTGRLHIPRLSVFAAALSVTAVSACAHGRNEQSARGPAEERLGEQYRLAYDSTDVGLYRAARDAHAAWLAEHGASSAARDIRVRYGKLLYALGDLERAAAEFQRAAEGAEKGDGLGRGALRNAIAALYAFTSSGVRPTGELLPLKDMGRIDRVALPLDIKAVVLTEESAGPVRERPIPEAERALSAACDRYFEIAEPDDPALPTIKLLSASIHFRNGHGAEGADRCADVIARWPHQDMAEACVRASIDVLNARQDWGALERHARAYRSNLSLIGADTNLERQLDEVVQGATFKRIQAAAESPQVKDAPARQAKLVEGAEAFRAFQREFPYSAYADKALYNAFVYLVQAGHKPDAMAALTALSEEYGTSPLVRDARRAMKALSSR